MGPEHPDTAQSLNNLAYVLGPEHPDTAASLNNLAVLLQDEKGNTTTAELLLRRSLAIYKKALGPEHPTTARSLNNLGELLLYKGERINSLSLARQAAKVGWPIA